MKLIIATPFYEMKGFSTYISSLVSSIVVLNKSGIDFEYWSMSGDSYVDRVRNTICEKFLEGDGTDLLFIDSDMSWDVNGFANILKSPFEVTGAAYPQKNNWGTYAVKIDTFDDGAPKVNVASGLIKADWVPAGFLRIKRSCLERFKKCYPDKYYYDRCADESTPERKYTAFFESVIENNVRYGEDITFCRRWAAMGGEVWVEPRITFGHCGVKEWQGNYHEYLHSLVHVNNIGLRIPVVEYPDTKLFLENEIERLGNAVSKIVTAEQCA